MNSMQMPVCIRLEDNFWDQLMWDKDLSDTTIQVKGKDGAVLWEFSVHSIVLRRRSRVFKQLITKIGETLIFDNVDITVLNKFIKYLYVGDIFVETWREVLQLVELASRYEVTSLTGELQTTLLKFINIINVCHILDEAIKLKLEKVEAACISLIVRSVVVIFGTGGFQGLSETALVKILSHDHLNVVREVDALLALICWARNSAFIRGTKLDTQALYERISTNLLKTIRLTLITDEEKKLLPENLVDLIYPQKNEKSEDEEDEDAAEDKPKESPRITRSDECLLGHFAHVLLRKKGLPISWPNLGHAVTMALRFSVTMPIFLGGFLAYYRCNGTTNMNVSVQDTKKDTEVKYPFKLRNCEHTMNNEALGINNHFSGCYEPDTPLLVQPGQQVTVHFQMQGPHVNEAPVITFPTTTIATGEGPSVQLSIDKVYAIRKIFFMSACGRCSVSPLM